MRRTLLALGGVVMILTTACGSSGHRTASDPTAATAPLPSPTTSTTTAVPIPTSTATTNVPSTTTTVPDTRIVPRTITVAYVDAVFAKLNHVYGEVGRQVAAARKLTVPAIEDLSSIYTIRLGSEEQLVFDDAVASGLPNLRRVPGDPITKVQKLIYASRSCIYAKVRTDSDPSLVHPVKPSADEYIGLRRVAVGNGQGRNPTPWIFYFDIVNKTPTNVPDQCVSH
jgi:hypothetical protein